MRPPVCSIGGIPVAGGIRPDRRDNLLRHGDDGRAVQFQRCAIGDFRALAIDRLVFWQHQRTCLDLDLAGQRVGAFQRQGALPLLCDAAVAAVPCTPIMSHDIMAVRIEAKPVACDYKISAILEIVFRVCLRLERAAVDIENGGWLFARIHHRIRLDDARGEKRSAIDRQRSCAICDHSILADENRPISLKKTAVDDRIRRSPCAGIDVLLRVHGAVVHDKLRIRVGVACFDISSPFSSRNAAADVYVLEEVRYRAAVDLHIGLRVIAMPEADSAGIVHKRAAVDDDACSCAGALTGDKVPVILHNPVIYVQRAFRSGSIRDAHATFRIRPSPVVQNAFGDDALLGIPVLNGNEQSALPVCEIVPQRSANVQFAV